MSGLFKCICAVIACVAGAVIAYYCGCYMNNYIFENGVGLIMPVNHWSVEAGAPPLAIEAVKYAPILFAVACGIALAIKNGFLSLFLTPILSVMGAAAVAFLSVLTCFILAFFITGTWVGILVAAALLGGEGVGTFYVFAWVFKE